MAHNQPDQDEQAAPSCPCNGEKLELVLTAPRVGPFPELKTYRCRECGHVVTIEAE
jgi:hypothetical protein